MCTVHIVKNNSIALYIKDVSLCYQVLLIEMMPAQHVGKACYIVQDIWDT